MNPYYTFNNGQYETDASSDFNLPPSTNINMGEIMASGSHGDAVVVYNWQPTPWNTTYSFAPGEALSQGEVNYNDDWMGGGSGETFTTWYQPQSMYPNGWIDWTMSACSTNGGNGGSYWSSCSASNSYTWSNGGWN